MTWPVSLSYNKPYKKDNSNVCRGDNKVLLRGLASVHGQQEEDFTACDCELYRPVLIKMAFFLEPLVS